MALTDLEGRRTMLTREDLRELGSRSCENALRERLDELNAIRRCLGGSYATASAEDAGTIRRLNGELELLGLRLEEARAAEGIADNYASYEEHVGAVDDYLNRTTEGHPGHGTTKGAGGESIKPVASIWAATQRERFAIGTNPRVMVPPGVLWGLVPSPTDTLAPADRPGVVPLGADRRYILAVRDRYRLGPPNRARAGDAGEHEARDRRDESEKPESAFTVVLVHTALEQVARKIKNVPTVIFANAGIRQTIDSELRLGLAEALDAQAIAAINAAGMATRGTGSTLAVRIRKAMTTFQAAGYNPDTVALSPADAETSTSSSSTFSTRATHSRIGGSTSASESP